MPSSPLAHASGKGLHRCSESIRQNRAPYRFVLRPTAVSSTADEYGHTPLLIALDRWHFDLAVLLCAAGADMTAKGVDVRTMLFRAVEMNNLEAVANLLTGGVNILSKDELGRTALELAME